MLEQNWIFGTYKTIDKLIFQRIMLNKHIYILTPAPWLVAMMVILCICPSLTLILGFFIIAWRNELACEIVRVHCPERLQDIDVLDLSFMAICH